MSTRHLLKQPRRSHRSPAAVSSVVSDTPEPAPPQLDQLINDTASLHLQSNLTPLQNPNPNPNPTLTIPTTRITTLPNGLRVATDSNPASDTATVCVWIDTGTRFETPETNGVASFIKHMVFQGTPKRSRSDFDKAEKEKLGAGTSREQTYYLVKVKAGEVPEGIDILSDMLQNSVFDEKVIDDLRDEILKDLFYTMSQPEKVVFEAMHAAAFRRSALARNIIGSTENIMKLTKKDMQDYLSTHYTTHRMVITASGAVQHEDIVEQVDKMFTKLSTNMVTSAQLVEKEPAIFTASEIRLRLDCAPTAHFVIVFKGVSHIDPDSITLMVIQTMLGSWKKATDVGKQKSLLLAQMEGIDELAEEVGAVTRQYKETGLFGVYACAKPDCVADLASAIMNELSKLCYQVEEEDVMRARNQLKGSTCKKELTAFEIGHQLLAQGRIIPNAEMSARIDAVDAAMIKRVANKFIFGQDIAIAAFGAVEPLPDYNWFRSRISVLPY